MSTPADDAPAVEFSGVGCCFPSRDAPGRRQAVLSDVVLSIAPDEVVAVVGPAGCGKSTLLDLAAGLLAPSSGTVRVFGEPLDGVNRRAGYLFQAEALLPWRSVRANVGAGPAFAGLPAGEARQRTDDWLARLGLSALGDRYPHQLSVGARRRVALAQALALDPDIVLMDEPFATLDLPTRQSMENALLGLRASRRQAVLFTTDDPAEAIALADRVVVLSAGPGSQPIGNFPIPLERPRDAAEIRMDRRFLHLLERIGSVLRDEVAKVWERQDGRTDAGRAA